MEKKLTYITYQTFPAKTANSIQTISTIKHLTRAGLDTTLIYPLRNQESSDDLLQLKNHYKFEDNIKLIGTIHPLPFKRINFFEKYWYLISHFLWSYFTVRKFYSSKQELYFTRSEWVFYFLSKKNANVIYECHQISKFKKILINKSLKKEKSKVIALTDEIKNEIKNKLIILINGAKKRGLDPKSLETTEEDADGTKKIVFSDADGNSVKFKDCGDGMLQQVDNDGKKIGECMKKEDAKKLAEKENEKRTRQVKSHTNAPSERRPAGVQGVFVWQTFVCLFVFVGFAYALAQDPPYLNCVVSNGPPPRGAEQHLSK